MRTDRHIWMDSLGKIHAGIFHNWPDSLTEQVKALAYENPADPSLGGFPLASRGG